MTGGPETTITFRFVHGGGVLPLGDFERGSDTARPDIETGAASDKTV